MSTKRTPISRRRTPVNEAAIDAWKRGDVMGCHEALRLAPFEYSPLPHRFGAYGLSDERPPRGTCMQQSWPKIKRLQDALVEAAGGFPEI